MADEGALSVTLQSSHGVVSEVRLRSTRLTDFSKVLVGLDVDVALRLVPTLFSVCAHAQGVAAVEACEMALGVEVSPQQHSLRRLVCALEALDNHAFQFFVEWPRLTGSPPKVAALREWRQAVAAVRAPLVHGDVARIGGTAGARVNGLETLAAVVQRFAPDGVMREVPQLEAAGRALIHDVPEGGASTAPLVPDFDFSWFLSRIGPDFSARPTIDGVPAESGAVTSVQSQPSIQTLLAQTGRTTWVRLLAKVCDVARLKDLVLETAGAVEHAQVAGPPGRTSGRGVGFAETSRGRLVHVVSLENRRVTAWHTVAPTEWSFHPDGALREALLGLPTERAVATAHYIVAGLDPCIACRVS